MQTENLPPPVWVDQPGTLQRMVETLRREPMLAVDTESNSLFAYRERVCLIQFSSPQTDYLVDPLALKDLSSLSSLFANEKIEKIFHAAEYDIFCLKRDYGYEFSNLFDTMVAARILGRASVGLGGLVEEEFEITLDKKYQRANWGQRPLLPAQLAYARLDTHYLFGLRERLRAGLLNTRRWELACEDFQRLTLLGAHPGENGNGLPQAFKLATNQELNPRQVTVLQELCNLRERLAERADQPVFKILSNQALIGIARALPQQLADLDDIADLSLRLAERYGTAILQAVQQGQMNEIVRREYLPRPDEAYLNRLDALKTWRKEKGAALEVESDVILPRDILEEIASANPQRPADLKPVMAQVPWRWHAYGDEILAVVHRANLTPLRHARPAVMRKEKS
jgi:ribonuclease D